MAWDTVRHLFDDDVVVLAVAAEFAGELGADGDVVTAIALERGDLVAPARGRVTRAAAIAWRSLA